MRRLTVLWSLGGPGSSLQQPVALAIDRAANRLDVVERDSGRLLTTWGGPGRQPGRFRFRRPLFGEEQVDDLPSVGGGVAVDGQGRVAVADYANHRLQWFDRNGRWLATWGHAGQRPGEPDLPWNLAIDACGRVVVADLWGSRVQVFAADGATLGWWALDGLPYAEPGRVAGLATGPDGHFVVTGGDAGLAWHDSTDQVVATGNGLRFGDGERVQPISVAIDERGDIYLIDQASRCLLKLRPTIAA